MARKEARSTLWGGPPGSATRLLSLESCAFGGCHRHGVRGEGVRGKRGA